MLDTWTVREESLHKGGEAGVEEEDAVLGVADDPCESLCKQTRIQGVEYGPSTRNGKVKFHMSVLIGW